MEKSDYVFITAEDSDKSITSQIKKALGVSTYEDIGEAIVNYKTDKSDKNISVTVEKINKVLGIEIPEETVVSILKDLGYKIAKTDSTGYCNFLFSVANCLGIDSKHSRIRGLSASAAYFLAFSTPIFSHNRHLSSRH